MNVELNEYRRIVGNNIAEYQAISALCATRRTSPNTRQYQRFALPGEHRRIVGNNSASRYPANIAEYQAISALRATRRGTPGYGIRDLSRILD